MKIKTKIETDQTKDYTACPKLATILHIFHVLSTA